MIRRNYWRGESGETAGAVRAGKGLLAGLRNNFAKYLATAGEEPVFVTKNGKIAAVIEHIDDCDIEDFALGTDGL